MLGAAGEWVKKYNEDPNSPDTIKLGGIGFIGIDHMLLGGQGRIKRLFRNQQGPLP